MAGLQFDSNFICRIRVFWCVAVLTTMLLASPAFAGAPTSVPTPPIEDNRALFLEGAENSGKAAVGQLQRELFRQAILVAARDGLGIETRDASLREWRGDRPAGRAMRPVVDGLNISLQVDADQSQMIWQKALRLAEWSDSLPTTAQALEALSRTELISALRKSGFSGSPKDAKADGAAPTDAEARLANLEILSQFAAMRETHEAIRSDGESPQRLGVLVRGYANLGQITRFHWSVANKVFFARALLYANRMVASEPASASALWHRAYALAFSGLPGPAMDDVAAATRLGQDAPPWSSLLEPYCKYQATELTKLAGKNPKLAPLAAYLAFVTVENSGWECKAAPIAYGQAALELNPGCLQIVDALCDRTGPGLLNDLTEQGPQIFSRTLSSTLANLPSVPPEVARARDLPQTDSHPVGPEQMCQTLIDAGDSSKDTGEPSWTALARLIQETTFAQLRRRAELISMRWGMDAAAYTTAVSPLIADHPYKTLMEAYGSVHEMARQATAAPLEVIDDKDLTVTALPLHHFWQQTQPQTALGAPQVWKAIARNADRTSFDQETLILSYRNNTNKTFVKSAVVKLRRVSPDAPLVIAVAIRDDWEHAKDQAGAWETNFANQPTISLALGEQYFALKQWDDAERCLQRYLDMSPDLTGYLELADAYRAQGKEDHWLTTLKEYLHSAPNYDLGHAQVQVKIANYYMDKQDFVTAIPYADAAAQTGAEWGIQCAERAHRGVGDADGARKLFDEQLSHYSRKAIDLYENCIRTGEGDRVSAAEQSRIDFSALKDQISDEDLVRWATLEMLEGDETQARDLWKRRMEKNAGPMSGLHIATLADAAHDSGGRDAAMRQVLSLNNQTSALSVFAGVLRDALAAGDKTIPDLARIDVLLKSSSPEQHVTISYLTARYLDQHGHADLSTSYLKRCCINHNELHGDLLLAYDALRKRGFIPSVVEHDNATATSD